MPRISYSEKSDMSRGRLTTSLIFLPILDASAVWGRFLPYISRYFPRNSATSCSLFRKSIENSIESTHRIIFISPSAILTSCSRRSASVASLMKLRIAVNPSLFFYQTIEDWQSQNHWSFSLQSLFQSFKTH